MNKYCHVNGCNYPLQHVTYGHKCGNCGKYGHGRMECNKPNLIKNLYKYGDYILPKNKRCRIYNCKKKWSHTTETHICETCNNIGKCNCDNTNLKFLCIICRKENIIKNNQIKIYNSDNKCLICLENNVEIYQPNCGHLCYCIDCFEKNNGIHPYNLYKNTILENDFKKNFKDIDGKIYSSIVFGLGSTIFGKRDDKNSEILLYNMHQDSWGQYGPETDERANLKIFIEDYKLIK